MSKRATRNEQGCTWVGSKECRTGGLGVNKCVKCTNIKPLAEVQYLTAAATGDFNIVRKAKNLGN